VIARRMKLSEGTVKAHVSSVLHILGASNRTSALIRAAALKIELS
jgi:DNA-binding NarL/FixJ family response regulator